MNTAICDGFFGRGRLKIAVPVLGLVMAMGLPGGTVWADRAVKPEGPAAAAQVDHQPLFKALDQWMAQNRASYNYDIPKLQDPFLPIKAVRLGGDAGRETFISYFTQLKLVAITMYNNGLWFLASFEDGAGAGYNLRVGDQVGPHKERVVKIDASTVTVESPGREEGEPARINEIKLPTAGPAAGLTRSGGEPQNQKTD